MNGTERMVLVVEDEAPMVRLLEMTLSRRGYQVLTATDGEKAIQTYCSHKAEIDVVLLDLGLPRVNGWDVFLRMKSERPDARIVVASGYLEPHVKSEMEQRGVQHFIQKPYSLSQVVETIERLSG